MKFKVGDIVTWSRAAFYSSWEWGPKVPNDTAIILSICSSEDDEGYHNTLVRKKDSCCYPLDFYSMDAV